MLHGLPAVAKDSGPWIGAISSVAFMGLSMALALLWVDRPTLAQPDAPATASSLVEAEEPPAPARTARQPDDVEERQPAQPEAPPLARIARRVPQAVATPTRPISMVAPPAVHRMLVMAKRPDRVEPAAVAAEEPRRRVPEKSAPPSRLDQGHAPTVAGVITPSMLRRLSARLNLTPEQRALYQPLERELLAIGAEQAALVRAGQDPKDAFSLGTAMSMYGAAQPFLSTLREDQKARVRAEARNMGFGFAASQI